MNKKSKAPATGRNWVAVSAQFRSSAGAMGGGKRTKNRRARQDAKRDLRSER